MNQRSILIFCGWVFTGLIIFPSSAMPWNIPTHMLHGAMTYHILREENPSTIRAVRLMLEHHPRQEIHWQGQLEQLNETERDETLFMLAARWADDIRNAEQHRGDWHYVHFPFKPAGESVQIRDPSEPNILTAMAENERLLRTTADPQKTAIALAWLFHLAGEVHQPLQTIQLFSREYPQGDRGGNEMCIRVITGRAAVSLNSLWDGLLTSSPDIRTLRNMATYLRTRFPKEVLSDIGSMEPKAWAKESFDVAVKVAYQNGTLRGTPKKQHKDCGEVKNAATLPTGYIPTARQAANRRIALAGYRLASWLNDIAKR